MRRASLALALAVFLGGSASHGHGSFPVVTNVSFRAGVPEDLMLGINYGTVLSRDGGATWRWVCEDAAGYVDRPDSEWLWTSAGPLLASTFSGVSVSTDGGCTWSFADGTQEFFIDDLQIHPREPAQVLASASKFEADGSDLAVLLRSMDSGLTFAPLGPSRPGRLFNGIAVAPSAPEHVYLASYSYQDESGSWILHSADGGSTWEEWRLEGYFAAELLAVDSSNPNVVYLSVTAPNALLRSEDAGQTFTTVLETTRRVAAVHTEAATSRVWAAEFGEAVHLSSDGGLTFSPLPDSPPANCLTSDGTALYACAVLASRGYIVGRSTDGVTFEPFMAWFDEIDGPLECPAGSPAASLCDPYWPFVAQLFGINLEDPADDEPEDPADDEGGEDVDTCECPGDPSGCCAAAPPPDEVEDGCSCGAQGHGRPMPMLATIGLIVLVHRRRGKARG